MLFASPSIIDRYVTEPSCQDPRGLELVDSDSVLVEGTPASEEGDWAKDYLLDGKTISVWVPEEGVDHPFLEFKFRKSVDLQMICVVNGVPRDPISYLNADRVRSLRVETDAGTTPDSPLLSLDEFDIQNGQVLTFEPGVTDSVELTIKSIYTGQNVYDPGIGEYSEATGRVGLSEVEFWVRN